ncbi:MAG: MFS transporter, partial [Chloroflexota bacterium]
MNQSQNKSLLPEGEFIALMAMVTALIALSTDAMLPALDDIGTSLGTQNPNDNQLVLVMLFLGLAVGQLFSGPLSDAIGRKPTVSLGYAVFIVGCILSIFATNMTMMLGGRVLQGLGVAGPRTVSIALIRDLYEGRRMARIMSFIMTVFILVPIIAPTLGQGILLIADWRSIFVALLLMALATFFWFTIRQPETLPPERRMLKLLGVRLDCCFILVSTG